MLCDLYLNKGLLVYSIQHVSWEGLLTDHTHEPVARWLGRGKAFQVLVWNLLFLKHLRRADHVAETVSGVGGGTRTETVLSLTAFTLHMPSSKEPSEWNKSRVWCNSLGTDSGLGQQRACHRERSNISLQHLGITEGLK